MNYADMEQMYGPLFEHSDYKRFEHVKYVAYDGQVRTGEILWVQEPGRAVGRSGQATHLKAQYVIQPDQDTGMVDFVQMGDILSE